MHRNYGNLIDEMSMYKHLYCVLNVLYLDIITFKFNTYFLSCGLTSKSKFIREIKYKKCTMMI